MTSAGGKLREDWAHACCLLSVQVQGDFTKRKEPVVEAGGWFLDVATTMLGSRATPKSFFFILTVSEREGNWRPSGLFSIFISQGLSLPTKKIS